VLAVAEAEGKRLREAAQKNKQWFALFNMRGFLPSHAIADMESMSIGIILASIAGDYQ
jgi:hypothetical protein